MEYIHKFSIRPVEMDKMLEEYHNIRKTKRYCEACPNYGKYWSCPEFAFDVETLLKQFRYVYLIAREYLIPREDRLHIIGLQKTANYALDINKRIKLEAWQDILNFEEEFPDTMGLIPGNCEICDITKEGCTKSKGRKCRYPDKMRFSLESLGFDVDAICKYEIGVLLMWPSEGHLPEKLHGIMGILSNEKIPMDRLKAHFPDTRVAELGQSQMPQTSADEIQPGAKRAVSWVDKLKNREKPEDLSYKPPKSWIGFKSDELNSGDYVEKRSWAEIDEENKKAMDTNANKLPAETVVPNQMANLPDNIAQKMQQEGLPKEALDDRTSVVETTAGSQPKDALPSDVLEDMDALDQVDANRRGAPEELPAEALGDMEDNAEEEARYQWLGFKRSIEEAEDVMMHRPIPKFNVKEEEETPEEETPTVETAAETKDELVAEEADQEISPSDKAFEDIPESAAEAVGDIQEPLSASEIAEEQEPKAVELPNPEGLASVLSSALDIAKDVVGEDLDVPAYNAAENQQSPAETATENDEEDDSKYRWLGFKATNYEAPEEIKPWKKNY